MTSRLSVIFALRLIFSIVSVALLIGCASSRAKAGIIEIKNNQLFVDGTAQPQLFGAEIQYFRLRGGEGRNIPREKVIALWNKALDRAVEAKMNTISFYIPWDFHEYADGKYDFDGTVDEDGDGKPDYPSRDLHTWLKLVEAHGFKHIMVRPGPYINAEWGFLGFGAVPYWFHAKFPESHAHNPKGQRTSLYNYNDPVFRAYSKRWLETVYQRALKPYIGAGRMIDFIQVDNETNFMWQSVFNHDFGAISLSLYRDFLKSEYGDIGKLNSAHGRSWGSFGEVQPPTNPGQNIAEDQDWYRFQDETMHRYLRFVRSVWTDLGVREPNVLFTLAESYNAAENGALPNYKLRNDPGATGMMTVNLYPKTYETPDSTLMNLPFKADHDVKAADSASDYYIGKKEQWVLGPEIQGGWWKGIDVSLASRQQTYLTVIGHGLKAMYIYYFNEGDNWQNTWAKDQILPYYDELRTTKYGRVPETELPEAFWQELNAIIADKIVAGWDAKYTLAQGGTQPHTLYFDAPLSGDAEARAPYAGVKEIGEKVIAPYGNFLGSAIEQTDDVCMIKDVAQHAPSAVPGLSSRIINSDWAGGLLALLLQTGINPRIVHWGINPKEEILSCKLVLYQDNGFATPEMASVFSQIVAQGGGVVNFLADGMTGLMLGHPPGSGTPTGPGCVTLPPQPMEVNGFRCSSGKGYVYQIKTPIYDVFNTDFYSRVYDTPARRDVVVNILNDLAIKAKLKIKGGGDRVVAFGRTSPDARRLWVTLKSGRLEPYAGSVQWGLANPKQDYQITDVFAQTTQKLSGLELTQNGFDVKLSPNGSTVYFVEPTP